MLGEYFIDLCVSACCSLDQKEENLQIFESIQFIMDWYKKETPKDDIPIEFMDKFELLRFLSNYRIINKKFNFDTMISKISTGKFKDLVPTLESMKTELDDSEIFEMRSNILSKRMACDMLTGKKRIQVLLTDVEAGNYVDDGEICERWEHEITRSWSKINDVRRIELVNDVASLDLLRDDYSSVERAIRETYNPANIIKTGYKDVDKLFPCGGFEKRRLYVIGGTSGVGKSAFLLNILRNALISDLNIKEQNTEDDLYLYISGENLISESLERGYCIFTGDPHVKMVDNILNNMTFSLKTELKNTLTKFKSNILMEYVKPGVTTSGDILRLVSHARQKGNLKAIYMDYIDLVHSGRNIEDLRLDIGQVCVDFKGCAVENNVPFITVTQLNRSGYDKEKEPSLTSMGESMKKVDNADFILYLQNADDPRFSYQYQGLTKECRKIKMTGLKNRNGDIEGSTFLMNARKLDGVKIFNYRFEEIPNMGGIENPTNPKLPPLIKTEEYDACTWDDY